MSETTTPSSGWIPPPPRRRWKLTLLIVTLVLVVGGGAIIAVATLAPKKQTATTTQTAAPRGLSSACQTAVTRFIDMKNASADATNSAKAALNHWNDVWNRYTSGHMSRAEYNAGMSEFRADGSASTTGLAKAKQQTLLLSVSLTACGRTNIPKACQAIFDQIPPNLAHEGREATAVSDAFTKALAQASAWNAHDVAASNAATAEYNAARDRMEAAVAEHNRLLTAFNAAQDACNKAT